MPIYLNVFRGDVIVFIKLTGAKPQTICVATRFYSTGDTNNKKMVDPKRVVSYEDVMKNLNKPEKVIIDVRNPDEVNSTGKIPSSINIPCEYWLPKIEVECFYIIPSTDLYTSIHYLLSSGKCTGCALHVRWTVQAELSAQ